MHRIIRRINMTQSTKIVSGKNMKLLCVAGESDASLTVWVVQEYHHLDDGDDQIELLVIGDDKRFPYDDFEYVASYGSGIDQVFYHLYARPYIPLVTEFNDKINNMEKK